MARLTDISFRRDGLTYHLDFQLDDAAMMRDQLVVELQARVVDQSGRTARLSLALEIDLDKDEARVVHDGRTLHVFSLSKLRGLVHMEGAAEVFPGILDEGDADPVGEAVSDGLGDVLLTVLENVPTPDPVLCLLKAGISSTIGQALVCMELVGGRGGARARAWKVAACLKDHAGGILTRTLWRTAKCLVTSL